MADIVKACKSCSLITEEDECKVCGSQTSREWQGYVVIMDHSRSEIARKMGIQTNGKFALRVR
ncbi:MAG: DNA-directed RNA polymerase subunit E [Thermoplasmata archaeon]|nr:DNA-directed RNA polymerase subunit E [Thermoplasmata archaeon]MCK5396997.1 DNA-directed RNA polymerase subunit E [Thermoplasmata archaeon]